jgi:hypothetical protein
VAFAFGIIETTAPPPRLSNCRRQRTGYMLYPSMS